MVFVVGSYQKKNAQFNVLLFANRKFTELKFAILVQNRKKKF